MTDITKLAQKTIELVNSAYSDKYNRDRGVLEMTVSDMQKCKQLAQAVIDMKPGQTARGIKMPQTPEEFAYMAGIYEEALLKAKEENSHLRAKYNKLKQRPAIRESKDDFPDKDR